MPTQTAQKITVRRYTESDRPALEKMYQTFQPPGEALGLPPPDAERRKLWLDSLRDGMQFAGFADDVLAGHLVLMPEGAEAELVCFVHQDHRRQGIATAMAEVAVEEARASGIRLIWLLINNSNAAGWQGLRKFGFHAEWEDHVESKFVYIVPPSQT